MAAFPQPARCRSWLFAPGNRPAVMQKALAGSADAVILDLEDAVPIAEKEAARQLVVEALRNLPKPRARVYVRVNALETPFALADLAAVAGQPIAGIVLPKADGPSGIATASWALSQLDQGGEAGKRIVPLIETPSGLAHARAIAAADARVECLAFGAGDFTLEMGLQWSRDEIELLPARLEIVLASQLAGIAPPLDAVWVEIADSEGMAASAGRARAHGFQGKMCIHPRQIDQVRDAFLPTEAEFDSASRILAGFTVAGGSAGAAVMIDGKMVDYPIVEAARRIVEDFEHARRGR